MKDCHLTAEVWGVETKGVPTDKGRRSCVPTGTQSPRRLFFVPPMQPPSMKAIFKCTNSTFEMSESPQTPLLPSPRTRPKSNVGPPQAYRPMYFGHQIGRRWSHGAMSHPSRRHKYTQMEQSCHFAPPLCPLPKKIGKNRPCCTPLGAQKK